MMSERKRLANQRNAQKSTGPKTAAGKSRSSRNATKHGLCASVEQLPPEDQALYHERLEGWTNDSRPVDQVASYLLATAVLASVQLDRCARHEFAAIARRRRRAIERWDHAQDAEVARLAVLLAESPALACEQLESFAAGCDWLIEQWSELFGALGRNGHWMPGQIALSLQLLGHDASNPKTDDPRVRDIRLNAVAADPEVDLDEAEAVLGLAAGELDREARQAAVEAVLPEPEAARAALFTLIEAEIQRLAALGDALWRGPEVAELSEQIDLATFDSSKKGSLRHRYQTSHALELHRTIRQFYQVQREAYEARRDGRLFPSPEPAPIQPPPVHTGPIPPPAAQPEPLRNEPTEADVSAEPAEPLASSGPATECPRIASCPTPATAPALAEGAAEPVSQPISPPIPPEGGPTDP